MKILIVIHNNHLYGANRSLLTIIERLRVLQDVELMVLTPSKGDMTLQLQKIGVRCLIIPYFAMFPYYKLRLKYLALPFLWLLNIFTFPIILWHTKTFKPSLIYSNTAAENLGIIVAKVLRIKHVWHIREFMDKDHGAKFIGGGNLKSKFVNLSDSLIFVSEAVSKNIKGSNNKRRVIYNGVKLDFNPAIYKELQETIKIGIVGVLDPSKGQLKAIEYFGKLLEKYSNYELHIFGGNGGTYEDMLIQKVENLRLDKKTYFHGFVRNVREIYSSIDILLMNSRSEGFGRVTVESMLAKIPVVGFNSGGTPELIENGHTGFLFSNEVEFIEAIHKVSNPSVYRYVTENAYNKALKKYSIQQYQDSVIAFLEEAFNPADTGCV